MLNFEVAVCQLSGLLRRLYFSSFSVRRLAMTKKEASPRFAQCKASRNDEERLHFASLSVRRLAMTKKGFTSVRSV
jgi:hypothetical protein